MITPRQDELPVPVNLMDWTMIRLYSTLTKSKDPLETVEPGKVTIYLCGPTVYKPSHIGHMIGPVIFDVVKRYLIYSGYQVTWVVNITDIDDKLIDESKKRGISMPALAEEMTADYMRNIHALGVDSIDHFPRATENIDQIIAFTQDLIQKGFAYESEGDVYFDVSKSHDYGKLSHRTMEMMRVEGGEMAERKHSAADFALWKSAKPGEPSWPSPWGPGRPGWHIECSVMSGRLLGATMDIHGGGLDLMFPHHENEIAQSEARNGKPLARYWVHHGLVQASDEVGKVGGRATRPAEGDKEAQEVAKISKSKGAKPFRELLAKFHPETIRFFLLATHYRRPIDFSDERIKEVETGLEAFYRFFQRYERITGQSFYAIEPPRTRPAGDFSPDDDADLKALAAHRDRFLEAMDDDFNTGRAIGELYELLRTLNRLADDAKLEDPSRRDAKRLPAFQRGTLVLREVSEILGVFRKPVEPKAGEDEALTGKLIGLLLEIRAESRKKKDFATADRIRNALAELGVIVEDRPSGSDWTLKK